MSTVSPPSMAELCNALRIEHDKIRELVISLDDQGLDKATPSPGWSIRDQLTHLAFFDERALESAIDPDGFSQQVASAYGDFEEYERAHLEVGRNKTPFELIGWWETSRSRLIDLFSRMDPKERLAWYGPEMSARSSASARYMETWAHGQDIADALEVELLHDDYIVNVCDLGVRTRSFSYVLRELEMPQTQVYVRLSAPSGDIWEWGDSGGDNIIEGQAVDFAYLVTQRRNIADLSLVISGNDAIHWMSICQAFAGPPGPGRTPKN